MAITLTADHAKQSLTAHVAAKGAEICRKYGSGLDWPRLQQLLLDRAYVRYPCEVRFDASILQPGEFAHPVPNGEAPEDGFVMHVHPLFAPELDRVPALVLYQLVVVNYGEFASADDAEVFGANALGLSQDAYYELLCQAADCLGGDDSSNASCHCGGSECGA